MIAYLQAMPSSSCVGQSSGCAIELLTEFSSHLKAHSCNAARVRMRQELNARHPNKVALFGVSYLLTPPSCAYTLLYPDILFTSLSRPSKGKSTICASAYDQMLALLEQSCGATNAGEQNKNIQQAGFPDGHPL